MVGCREIWRQEFRLKHFLLQHDEPRTFIQFQWGHQGAYLIWRIFWALYHVGWIIASGVRADMWAGEDTSQHVKWFIYLTDWAYFTLTLATIADAVAAGYAMCRRSDIRQGLATSLPWYMRGTWFIVTMANGASVVTSVAYWALVYDGTYAVTSIDAATHIVNSVYVILNVSVSGMPVRLLHFWIPVIFGVVYALFSLFYHLAGGTNHLEKDYIYSALDWNDAGTAAMYCVIVAFVAVPVIHLILFLVHILKVWLSQVCHCCDTSYELDGNKSVEMN